MMRELNCSSSRSSALPSGGARLPVDDDNDDNDSRSDASSNGPLALCRLPNKRNALLAFATTGSGGSTCAPL